MKGAVVLADGAIGYGLEPGREGAWRRRRHLHTNRRLHEARVDAGGTAVGRHPLRRRDALVWVQGHAACARSACASGWRQVPFGFMCASTPCSIAARCGPSSPSSRARGGPTIAWCWSRTCRSPAPTTTPADAARCSPPRWPSSARIGDGQIPPLARTLTLIWGDENRASDAWIAADPARARRVVAMMSLDMTGEDTSKTGGTFLIEKGPDPTAFWDRPSDPHSEWGRGKSTARCSAARS